jgi:hypothetical protein
MNSRKLTDKYNVKIVKPTLEEEIITTELSDLELDILYKKYKVMTTDFKDDISHLDE